MERNESYPKEATVADSNKQKQNQDALSEGRQIVRDLGIEEHMEIFAENGIFVDAAHIGNAKYPAIEIVHGLLFRRLADRTEAPLAIASKHVGLFPDQLRNGGRGDKLLDCPIHVFAAWTRLSGKNVVFLDEDDQPMVEVATPLAFYSGADCTIPETPVNGLVAWSYRDGRKTRGLFLPLDLKQANKEGWFSLSAAHVGIRTSIQMFPGIRRDRKTGKPRGIEPNAMHLSGLRIVSPLPPIADWGDECEVHLTQRGRILFAIPLPSVGSVEASAAIDETVSEGTDVDIGDGIEIGPEQIRYGKGVVRGIWEFLANAHKTKGVEFDPITEETSFSDLKKAKRMVATAIHPDKLQGRLEKVPGLTAAMIASAVKQAGLQWSPLCEAFDKALAVRDSQWEEVGKELGETVLDKEALAAASKATAGEDAITKVIGLALRDGFSWKNPNHVGLRNKTLATLRERAKAAEPEVAPDPAAPVSEEAPAPAPEAETPPPATVAAPEEKRVARTPTPRPRQTTARRPGEAPPAEPKAT